MEGVRKFADFHLGRRISDVQSSNYIVSTQMFRFGAFRFHRRQQQHRKKSWRNYSDKAGDKKEDLNFIREHAFLKHIVHNEPGGFIFPRRTRLLFRFLLVAPFAVYLGKDAYEHCTRELEYSEDPQKLRDDFVQQLMKDHSTLSKLDFWTDPDYYGLQAFFEHTPYIQEHIIKADLVPIIVQYLEQVPLEALNHPSDFRVFIEACKDDLIAKRAVDLGIVPALLRRMLLNPVKDNDADYNSMTSRMLRSVVSGPEAAEALVSQPGFPLILAACEAALPNRPITIRYILERFSTDEKLKAKMPLADVERIDRCLEFLADFRPSAREPKPTLSSPFVNSFAQFEDIKRGTPSLEMLAASAFLFSTNSFFSLSKAIPCAVGVTSVYALYYMNRPKPILSRVLDTGIVDYKEKTNVAVGLSAFSAAASTLLMASIPEVAIASIMAVRLTQWYTGFDQSVKYLAIPNSMDVKAFADALEHEKFNDLVQKSL